MRQIMLHAKRNLADGYLLEGMMELPHRTHLD